MFSYTETYILLEIHNIVKVTLRICHQTKMKNIMKIKIFNENYFQGINHSSLKSLFASYVAQLWLISLF